MKRTFVVVENAGYVGETDTLAFPTIRAALKHISECYAEGEADELHVAIRTDFEDGTSEYQS